MGLGYGGQQNSKSRNPQWQHPRKPINVTDPIDITKIKVFNTNYFNPTEPLLQQVPTLVRQTNDVTL